MKRQEYKYKRQDMNCKYCLRFIRGRCREIICPWMSERIETGVVEYKLLFRSFFLEHMHLQNRLKHLLRYADQPLWKDKNHKHRFTHTQIIYDHFEYDHFEEQGTNVYYAALYLLTADADLFSRMSKCFTNLRIDFRFTQLLGMNIKQYALYKAAKSLYTQSNDMKADELADPEIYDEEAFRLVINAILISRYGPAILSLDNEGDTHGSIPN